jgi:hypothetical protein
MRIKSFLFMTLLLGLAAAAHASIITTDSTDPACPTSGTYSTLISFNPGGCSINVGGGASLTFSNFTFVPTGSGTPTDMGYMLDNPVIDMGEQDWGFDFNPGLAVLGTSIMPSVSQDILITYKVVAMGTAIISDHLMTNAAAAGGGLGEVTETLTFCTALDVDPTLGTCHEFGGNPLTVTTINPPSSLFNVAHFGPWTSMTVTKDMIVSSGMAGGFATMSQVRDSLDVVPEPGTWALLALGGLLIGISRFRSRTQN